VRTAFLKEWLSNAGYLVLLPTVSLPDFANVFAKPLDTAIRKKVCASEMVAENLTLQKSQFELSL